MIVAAITGFALGAIGRRVVGGVIQQWVAWKPPHTLACIFWACCIGGAAAAGGAVWWACVVIGLGAWLGHAVLGLWDSAGMGHYGDRNELWTLQGCGAWLSAVDGQPKARPGFTHCWLGMTAYGLQCSGAAALLAFCPLVHGWWLPPLLGGLLVAPAYTLAWALWPHLPMRRGVTGNPLELAEWLAGGVIGASVCLGMANL